jgi:hypothetical protein
LHFPPKDSNSTNHITSIIIIIMFNVIALRAGQGLLASGSADTTVKLWRLPSGGGATLEAVQTLRGHSDAVRARPGAPGRVRL